MQMAMRTILLAIGIVASINNTRAADERWTQVADGLRVMTTKLTAKDNRKVTATFVVCRTQKIQVRVVDVYQLLGQASASSLYSLEDVFSKVKPLVAINGGPTDSFSFPSPVGLLISAGRQRSPLNRKADNSGVVCFTDFYRERIDWAYNFRGFACPNGIQSAPVLFVGDQTPSFNSRQLAARSVVASGPDDLVLVQTDPISISDLAEALRKQSPLPLIAAICLDGSSSSGMIVKSEATIQRSGSTRTLIASAIVVERRK